MDDPAIVLTGSWEEVVVLADVLVLLWLSVGVPLSWKKGLLSAEAHMWIGVVFDPRPSVGDVKTLNSSLISAVSPRYLWPDDLSAELVALLKL
eukprot:6018291-Amphidinium_carterae.1